MKLKKSWPESHTHNNKISNKSSASEQKSFNFLQKRESLNNIKKWHEKNLLISFHFNSNVMYSLYIPKLFLFKEQELSHTLTHACFSLREQTNILRAAWENWEKLENKVHKNEFFQVWATIFVGRSLKFTKIQFFYLTFKKSFKF